jgi:hypothetical protein
MKFPLSLFPRASRSFLKANEIKNLREVPNPESQPDKAPALDAADAREKKSIRRVTVRFIGYRVRPLDPDNFAGSCKDLLDGLRHAGILLGDEPWRVIFETAQEKVASFKEERTLIEIDL